MKKVLFNAISGALLAAALGVSMSAVAQTTEPMTHAGEPTAADRARAAGYDVKEDTKEAYDATKHGVKKGYRATKHGTKKAYHATKHSAKKAGNGAENMAETTGDAMSNAGHKTAGAMRRAGHAVGEKIPGTAEHDAAMKH